MTGLGAMGPFGMLIHREHGPWWAMRGAWLVDAPVDDPAPSRAACDGCAAPCVSSIAPELRRPELLLATPDVRARCVVGRASRYDDEQIGWHYDRENARARLRARA